ncbi:MAG TPA: pitrilysin family protein [Cyclobacteriaceae bacterium]|nr:pitrilysin family protein [Cyclobacteriaceae bacterium]
MRKIFLSLGCVFLIGTASWGQARKIEFTEYNLDNGLHVILHKDNTTPIVAVSVLYHVGSKNENPERTGFAHFFEHLLFEGSENIKRGEFDKYITNAGGNNNANTNNDRTFYYEMLPSNQLELGLWLESERMMHAKIETAGVETQREVVKEEKRQRVDNQPYGSFVVEVLKHAYTVHPYRWAPIGSMDHLNAATLDEFIDFYKTFYVPNNATLSIAGDIDIDNAKTLIAKYFKDIPKGTKPIPRPTVTEPQQTKEVRDVVLDNIQLPAVIHAYHMPAQGTPDSYALDMLSTLLSGGESSRLNKALVDDQKTAFQVGSFPFSLEDPGLYIVLSVANMGVNAETLEKAMDVEIEKVQKELISEKEFQKVKNQVESQFVQQNASMAGIAEQLANYHVYFGDANLINTEINRYNKVTREDLQRVAKKYLTKENRVSLFYLPKSAQSKPDNTQIKQQN